MKNTKLIRLNVETARVSWHLYLRYQREALPFTAARYRREAQRCLRAARQLKNDARF